MPRYIIEIRTFVLNGREESRYVNNDEAWPQAFMSIEAATSFYNPTDIAFTMHDYGRAEERDRNQGERVPTRPRADRVIVHEMP